MVRRFALRLQRPRFRGTATPVATVGQSARRLVLLSLLSALLVGALYVVAVLTPVGQALDDLVLFGRPRSVAAIELAWRALGTLNLAVAVAATLGLAGIALAVGRPLLAGGVVAAIAGANLTAQLLKETILERPNLVGPDAYAYGNSFPSGHVTLAASLALAALLVAPRRLRSLAALGGAAYVGIVGISTLTAGWHRLGDGIGAILVALAWTSLVAAFLAATRGAMPRRSWHTGSGRLIARLLLAGAMVLFLAALGFLAYAWATRGPAGSLAEAVEAPRAFFFAMAVQASGALLASASLLWALRGVTLEVRGAAPDQPVILPGSEPPAA